MITTDAGDAFDALSLRLADHAKTAASATARLALMARRRDERRWRRANLLWPLFTKG